MLKILKSELEANEYSISVGSINNEAPPNRCSSSALYSGFKGVSKKCVFCDENHSACIKIADLHARKRFLISNGYCFICFEKSHAASSCNQNYFIYLFIFLFIYLFIYLFFI